MEKIHSCEVETVHDVPKEYIEDETTPPSMLNALRPEMEKYMKYEKPFRTVDIRTGRKYNDRY